jgi:hypothetical protein
MNIVYIEYLSKYFYTDIQLIFFFNSPILLTDDNAYTQFLKSGS